MDHIDHYFENLLLFGKDIEGNPNKNALSEEVQKAVEICAFYIIDNKLSCCSILEKIKSEIEDAYEIFSSVSEMKNAISAILENNIEEGL